jgi:hypothetical protein
MGFPAVWAAAVVGTHIEGKATRAIATDAIVKAFENWLRRMEGTFP